MNHSELKKKIIAEGKQKGMNLSDLKVLSTDPYLVGTEKDYIDAQWAADLWDKMMTKRRKPLHLRGFHYWVMSNRVKKPDGNYYTEPDPAKDWGFLLHAAQVARYLGIGEWRNLVDLKHPEPTDYDNYWVGSGLQQNGEVDIQTEINAKCEGLVEEILKDLLYYAPKYHTEGYQLYHLEVWCEKNSMGFVIEPSCRRYKACYQPLVGQSSVEKVNMSAERAVRAAEAGKKVRIFYISDYDRYGCFAGSTLITTNKNEKTIRNINVGDELLTFNNGTPVVSKVQAIDAPWVPISSMLLLKIEGTTGVNRGNKRIVRTMIVSKKHPIYTLNRGYVNAEDITSEDILLDAKLSTTHFKNVRPRPANSVHRKNLIATNPEFRQIMIDNAKKGGDATVEKYGSLIQAVAEIKRIQTEEPERYIEGRKNSLASLKKLPSRLELGFINEVSDLPIEYTGNGKLFVKGFCPDFRVIGERKLIELSDPKFLKVIGKDYEKYKEERQIAYAKDGYKTLFLAYEGSYAPLVEKTKLFVVNGAKLISKEEINSSHISRLSHMGEVRTVKAICSNEMETQMKVYNLYCEQHNSFVASGVMVHNWSMVSAVARKLEFFVKGTPNLDIKLTRLALSEDQIQKFNLPKAPKHGEEVVELDALEAIHPGELGKIVDEALKPYYDSEKPHIVDEENRRIKERAKQLLTEKLKEPLEKAFSQINLKEVVGGFDLTQTVDEKFEVPDPNHEAQENGTWVYDSNRNYFEQLLEYKKYKSSREEEEV